MLFCVNHHLNIQKNKYDQTTYKGCTEKQEILIIEKDNIINHIFPNNLFEFLNNRNLEIFVINSFSKHFLK